MVGLSITVQDLAAGRLISVFSGDFERFPVRIGRHEGNDLALPAFAFVSRWHAEVRCDPSGALSLVCLAAHNPLKIAATPLATGASHPIGERLTATLSTLEFSFARRPSPALTSAPPPRDDLGPLPLIPSHPSAPRPAGPRAPEAPPQLPDLPADDRRYLARRAPPASRRRRPAPRPPRLRRRPPRLGGRLDPRASGAATRRRSRARRRPASSSANFRPPIAPASPATRTARSSA
jgi:hypothetical protein